MNQCNYEPPWEATRKLILCRQDDITIAGKQFPGLLGEKSGYYSDGLWFFIAVIGELIAIGTTIYGGVRNGIIFFIIATIIIIILIFCNFFFAILLHRKVGHYRSVSAYRIKDTYWLEDINQFRITKRRGRFVYLLLYSGLILIAIIKIIGVVILGLFWAISLYLPFVIIHIIVAYAHIKHTGYYMAGVNTKRLINKGFKQFVKHGLNVAKTRTSKFTVKKQLRMPIIFNCHKIEELHQINGTDSYYYYLITKGVLTDSDIIGLINGQTPEHQWAIFRFCREIQLAHFC